MFVALVHKETRLVSLQIRLVSERKLKRMQRSTYREVQRRLFELWQAFNKMEKSHILCHNLLGTNRPEGWVRTDRKWVRNVWAWVRIVWVPKIHEYETTGNRYEETVLDQTRTMKKTTTKSVIVHHTMPRSWDTKIIFILFPFLLPKWTPRKKNHEKKNRETLQKICEVLTDVSNYAKVLLKWIYLIVDTKGSRVSILKHLTLNQSNPERGK